MRRLAAFVAASSLLACSSTSTPETAGDAGVSVARAASPIAIVRSHAVFAERLSAAPLRAVEGGFAPSASPARGALRAVLPRRSVDPVRVAHERGSVAIAPLDLDEVGGETDAGARVFAGAARATDLVVASTVDGFEELRVLRSAAAPTTFRWSISGGVPRLTERGVEIVDADGVVRLAAPRPFARDARGVERLLALSVDATTGSATEDGAVLTARLDASGLAFPVVVDPSWTSLPNLRSVSGAPLAFTLPSGKVAVFPRDAAPWVDVFDPATNTWSAGPDVPVTWSGGSSAGQLANGDVVFLGSDKSFARYVAATGTWATYAATQQLVCAGCTVTRLNDGRLFKFPGNAGVTTPAAEIFNPTTNTWSGVAAPRLFPSHSVVTLADGRVMAFESLTSQTLLVYNPATNTWADGPAITRYAGARMVRLKDNRVLLTGFPSGGTVTPTARVIDAAATSLSPTYNFAHGRLNPSLVLLPSGRVMAAGGSDVAGTTFYSDIELWDPLFNQWTAIDPLTFGRSNAGIAVFGAGSVLLVGGNGSTGIRQDAVRYDLLLDGASCVAPAYAVTCNAAYCVDGVCCNAASCPGGTCAAPAVPGRAAGTCAKNLGQACGANADCASNFCVDGVCCNSACNGQCQACNLPGTPGTCRATTGAPVGGRTACGGAGAGTVCGATCNGVDGAKCNYGAAGLTACGKESCAAGVETVPSTCNGAGACTTTTNPCGAYACGASLCKRSCAVEADCAAGNYCLGDKCLPKVGLGSACTSDAICPSGLSCTDGVCCGVKSCGEGSSCAAGAVKGECKKLAGTACAADAECGSGSCADGVCCNRKCDGQCEACDLPATKGTCSPVSGVPRGARAACDDGGGDRCKAKTCDGATDPTACTAFKNGGTVVCKTSGCDGASLVPASTCDGAGSCVTPPPAKCGKYACNPAGASGPECREACAKNSDCAEGFSCVGGVCSEGARCTEDRQSSTSTDGLIVPCAPYICGTDGTCLRNCATTGDCAAGTLCEVIAGIGTCKKPDPVAEDGGGCAFGARPGDTLASLSLLVLGLAAARRRVSRRPSSP